MIALWPTNFIFLIQFLLFSSLFTLKPMKFAKSVLKVFLVTSFEWLTLIPLQKTQKQDNSVILVHYEYLDASDGLSADNELYKHLLWLVVLECLGQGILLKFWAIFSLHLLVCRWPSNMHCILSIQCLCG